MVQFILDPWYVDYADPLFGNTLRNRGTQTTGLDALQFRLRPSPFNPDYNTTFPNDNGQVQSYKGVFLNQDYNVPGNPYYSAKVELEQSVILGGDSHKFYFQGWSYDPNKISLQYPNSNQTGVVFKSSDPTVLTAKLKGSETTSSSTAYSNTSQSKFIKSPNGYLHSVYESQGDVWYERSTDAGTTWVIMNNGHPINPYYENGEAKSPSIACSNDANDLIYITYQSTIDNNNSAGPFVILTQYKNGVLNWHQTVYGLQGYSFAPDYQQVAAATSGISMVIFNPPSPTTPEFISKEYNISGSPNFNVTQETASFALYKCS